MRFVPQSWWPSLYVFALSEGYLKDILKVGLWFPMQRLGAILQRRRVLVVVAAIAGVVLELASARYTTLAGMLLVIALAFSACGLARWQRPARALLWISASSLLAMMAGAALADDNRLTMVVYGGGIAVACALGYLGFAAAALLEGTTTRFSGRWELRPAAAAVAFTGALGLAGAPLWPTFWGEDLVIHATLGANRALAVVIAVVLAANGYLGMRNFAYAFMGRSSPSRASRATA